VDEEEFENTTGVIRIRLSKRLVLLTEVIGILRENTHLQK